MPFFLKLCLYFGEWMVGIGVQIKQRGKEGGKARVLGHTQVACLFPRSVCFLCFYSFFPKNSVWRKVGTSMKEKPGRHCKEERTQAGLKKRMSRKFGAGNYPAPHHDTEIFYLFRCCG